MVITICRKRKVEAVRAMTELLQRGWEISHPLTEIKTSITERGSFNYRKNRYESRYGSTSSVWVAKLRRDENDENDKK